MNVPSEPRSSRPTTPIVAGLVARARSLWRALRSGSGSRGEVDEEFRHHMAMRTEDLVREGLSPADAARRARLEFGSTERYQHEGRVSRGLRPFDALGVSWLDVKLGVRMLVKYPGLTLVGGFAMAFAIGTGAGTFELVTQLIRPTLPLPDGDRIVGLQLWDAQANQREGRALHDFVQWRGELRSVRELGATHVVQRNLITGDGHGEPVAVAEISASAFRLTRVPPLLGRALVDADEQPGAPSVVVIGYDLWQSRFGGDSAVVGASVRLGDARSIVAGVMPEGYSFPVNNSLWAPLRAEAMQTERRQGPDILIFGRLAPGITLQEAQAELAALGRRAAGDFPDTHAQLRPRVLPYPTSILNLSGWGAVGVASVNLPLLLLLALICANVALLMFARAATRETELVVRTALGASRRRIVMQLFTEALVLGAVAAVVGLVAATVGLRWVMTVVEGEILDGKRLPFWFSDRLSVTTMLYAALLTVGGAVLAGVMPALKVTRGLQARLKEATAGGGGLRFGGVWTAVIIVQVGVTVAFPVIAFGLYQSNSAAHVPDVGFPTEEYLTARLEMDRESTAGAAADAAAFRARYAAAVEELERRLTAEPAVRAITYADRLPRMYHELRMVEVDAGGAAPVDPRWPEGYRVSSAQVDPRFFEVLGVPILRGRGFHAGDVAKEGAGGGVIVNESFVQLVLAGANPIGRRIRDVPREETGASAEEARRGPWYEIVGVVRDMGMDDAQDPKRAGFYHPVAAGDAYPTLLAVHMRGDAAAFAPRLRALAATVDPTLRLYDTISLAAVNQAEREFVDFWFRLLFVVSAVALTLSLAGIYAVMSFTVARRTREIGIRVALGADRRRVVLAIFRRPLTQVTLGVLAGVALIGGLIAGITAANGGTLSPGGAALLGAYAMGMLAVCLLACVVPTRRALGVEPTEALRAEG